MTRGTVTQFNDIIGRGVITPDDHSGTVKVTHKAIVGSGYKILSEGDVVEFELVLNGNVRSAKNVLLIEQ